MLLVAVVSGVALYIPHKEWPGALRSPYVPLRSFGTVTAG
jgi:hypothetical protein